MTTTEKRRLSQRLCLVLLAVLLLDSTPAKAVYNPRITGYSPSSASAGTEVTIQGTGLHNRPYTVMYGTPGSISSTGEIPRDHILDWRGTAVRFRVPRAMRPGKYWVAIYAGETLRSNQLAELRITPVPAIAERIGSAPRFKPGKTPVKDVAHPTATARGVVTDVQVPRGARCHVPTTLRLIGGPFQVGTDSTRQPSVGVSGVTRVHVMALGHSDWATRMLNQYVHSVHVVSESELEVSVDECVVFQYGLKIQVIFPDGRRSPWAEIPAPRY